jgi:anti-sigma factor RsiW
MNCPQFDHRIVDYLENQLPPEERALMTVHLAGCADCRTLAEQLQRLDLSLARALTRPELLTGFAFRLNERLKQEVRLLPERERAERKRQLEAEFDRAIERLNQQVRSLGSLRLVPGCALVAGLAGLVSHCLARSELQWHVASSSGQWLLLIWISSVGFILVGLAVAFPREFKRFWTPS